MVVVYAFEAWDPRHDEMVRQPQKCPLWRIQEIGGYPVEGTDEDVSESALDDQYRYDPAPQPSRQEPG